MKMSQNKILSGLISLVREIDFYRPPITTNIVSRFKIQLKYDRTKKYVNEVHP